MRTVLLKAFLVSFLAVSCFGQQLKLNDKDCFETQGLTVLVHQNAFHPVFFDQKLAGLEIILHGERIATDGDIRLVPTPEQWDAIPHLKERKREQDGSVSVFSSYPEQNLSYRMRVTPEAQGFRVTVDLDQPVPEALIGKAGFNLEFLPTSYFGKTYMLDTGSGIFPRHPGGPMQMDSNGVAEPLPLAKGQSIVLSPEDPLTRLSITSDGAPVMLYDGRNKAQNGWFVVRTLIPAGKTESAIVWHVRPNVIAGWTRPPVIGINQAGYTPGRQKVAVIELDPLYKPPSSATLLKLSSDGEYRPAYRGDVKPWGKWLRYQYQHFDFSSVHQPGVYVVQYGNHRSTPFRIADNVYKDHIWQASLDTWLPEQMDHVAVRENYRVWHGPSHLDDARQAPLNYTHFDGYGMGATTDTKYAPGEHIPGLNVGGWFDAGDFDIRTQSQVDTVVDLVLAREQFGLDWDQTTVDEKARSVEIRKTDGVPDVLQQIEHGVLQLLAQQKAAGHAIPGMIAPVLQQYTHLGDAGSKTDRKIYSDKMGPLESDGNYSGVPDDRWAFTTHTTPLNYHSAAALAAASRVLRGYKDALADECLETAKRVWDEEHQHPPIEFQSFNTAGGRVDVEETRAAVELLLATNGADVYRQRLNALLPDIDKQFLFLASTAVRAIPFMDAEYKDAIRAMVTNQKAKVDGELAKNPYGVPINVKATWGGSHQVTAFGTTMYFLHKAFPDLVGPEYTLRALDYVLGTHPASSQSLVSTVGADSKLIAYGNNRADYTFIPGGMVPGMIIVQPDFPELKHDWPFLWFENEYVIDTVANYILEANAAGSLAQ
jgi:endoglucanase